MSSAKHRRIATLYARQNGRCHWCKCQMKLLETNPPGAFGNVCTLDHLYSRGDPRRGSGRAEATVAACWDCNNRRGHEHAAALRSGIFSRQKCQPLTPEEENRRRRAVADARPVTPLA
jgi:hypothetical protein